MQDALNRDVSDKAQMDQDFLDAMSEFNRRHMCRADPCPVPDYMTGSPPANKALYHYMWGPVDFRGIGTLADYTVSPHLPRINIPALMVCGEFDEARPRSCKKYAGMISSSKTIIIEDAGHATPIENEEELLSALRAFLKELD